MARSGKSSSAGTPGRPNAQPCWIGGTTTDWYNEINSILTLDEIFGSCAPLVAAPVELTAPRFTIKFEAPTPVLTLRAPAAPAYTGWQFYDETLSDTTATYTFTNTRTGNATNIGSDGYIDTVGANAARYEYAAGGGAEALGLLHEDTRTNLLLQTGTLLSSWTLNSVTTAADVGVTSMIEGSSTKVTVSGAGAQRISQIATVVSGSKYCLSFFVKYGDNAGQNTKLRVYDAVNDPEVDFSWSGGVPSYSSDNGFIDSYGVEAHVGGWYRLWMVFTPGSTSANCQCYVGVSAATSKYMYFGCAQVELVSYADSLPSSWIATTTASVQRQPDKYVQGTHLDIAENAGATVYMQAKLDAQTGAPGAIQRLVTHYDTSQTNNWGLARTTTGANDFLGYVARSGGTTSMAQTKSGAVKTMVKYAVTAKSGDSGLAVAGTTGGTGTITPVNLTDADTYIGQLNDATLKAPRLIVRELRIYPSHMSDAELATLTT